MNKKQKQLKVLLLRMLPIPADVWYYSTTLLHLPTRVNLLATIHIFKNFQIRGVVPVLLVIMSREWVWRCMWAALKSTSSHWSWLNFCLPANQQQYTGLGFNCWQFVVNYGQTVAHHWRSLFACWTTYYFNTSYKSTAHLYTNSGGTKFNIPKFKHSFI